MIERETWFLQLRVGSKSDSCIVVGCVSDLI